MFNPESYFHTDREQRIIKIKELCGKAFQYIKENFNLDGRSEALLDEVFRNLEDKLKTGYSAPVISLDFILQPEVIQETAGECYINPYTRKPDFRVIIESDESPESIVEKIIHEVLHLLGTYVKEVKIIKPEDRSEELKDFEKLLEDLIGSSSISIEEEVIYDQGPLKELIGYVCRDLTSEMRYFLTLPSGRVELNIFYETAVDYFSKKIISEITKKGVDFRAGYITRIVLKICLFRLAYLMSIGDGTTHYSKIQELENDLRYGIITGHLDTLIGKINQIPAGYFLEELKKIIPRFEKWGYKSILEKVILNTQEENFENKETFDILLEILKKFYEAFVESDKEN